MFLKQQNTKETLRNLANDYFRFSLQKSGSHGMLSVSPTAKEPQAGENF
jgi:hypothetical protein